MFDTESFQVVFEWFGVYILFYICTESLDELDFNSLESDPDEEPEDWSQEKNSTNDVECFILDPPGLMDQEPGFWRF